MEVLGEILTNTKLANAASLVGLAVSVIGFILTLIAVWRSRAAAEQAREAATRVHRDLGRIDAVADVAAAISSMDEIKRLQRRLAWEILPDRYAILRKHLISIKASFAELSDDERAILQSAILHFAGIENMLEKRASADLTQKDAARLNKTVSKQADALHEVLAQIRNRIGEHHVDTDVV